MHVVKRNGARERVCFDTITERLQTFAADLHSSIDCAAVAQKVVARMYDGVLTTDLDGLACETAAHMSVTHPDYSRLAARLAASDLHKSTPARFSEAMHVLWHDAQGAPLAKPVISNEVYELSRDHAERLDAAIDMEADFRYSYFGLRTLQKQFLLRARDDNRIVERPQFMLLRVALGVHGADLDRAIEMYQDMSRGDFTPATPTLFNAGTPVAQMASCFLLQMTSDSIDGIFETLRECALISKSAGGIGLSVDKIRATGSRIHGSGGVSNGLVPMLRVFNNTARYVDQGGGKRNGAFAVYLQPWHPDVMEFLELKKNHGKEEARARDLFYAMWIPDLFMRRVVANEPWSLFCPTDCPRLLELHSDAFDDEYARCEAAGLARKQVPAQTIWFAILDSQIETGTPYLLYKDAANRKSNQQNLGLITCSNLCTEILEYTSPEEVAVCNLASIALPRFVRDGVFDFARLRDVVGRVVRNLNRVIDRNHYPLEKARLSNLRHRPTGIGVQGLANVFIELRLPYDAPEARALNRQIFEHMYFAALSASVALAREEGAYASFAGSPLSEGKLQCDLWGVAPTTTELDWDGLRRDVRTYGARNSQLIAPMPTATTAQILGNNECFEPYTSNVFTRRVLAGDFAIVNERLVADLVDVGLWNADMRRRVLQSNGTIQEFEDIPAELRALYKTAWEMSNSVYIDYAADRGPFVCQSQSLNLYLAAPTTPALSSMHVYAWKAGLKTGIYYLHTKPAADAIKFTAVAAKQSPATTTSCPRDCLSCSA